MKEQIIEYFEVKGEKFYLNDYNETSAIRTANAIEVLEKINKENDTIIYYSNAYEVILKGFDLLKLKQGIQLIAPNAEKVDCSSSQIVSLEASNAKEVLCTDNSLLELILPKAKKVDVRGNPLLKKIEAPNCEEINLKIHSICKMKKSDIKVSPTCKIASTDILFYKDDFYAYLDNFKGEKIELPVNYDGTLDAFIFSNRISDSIVNSSYNPQTSYQLITNAKYIKVYNLSIAKITAPNCVELNCKKCMLSHLELPIAEEVNCSENPLLSLNAPEAIKVDCSNTLLEEISLPLVIDLNCSNCKNLLEVNAPIYEKIDFRGSENLNRKNINKNKY